MHFVISKEIQNNTANKLQAHKEHTMQLVINIIKVLKLITTTTTTVVVIIMIMIVNNNRTVVQV